MNLEDLRERRRRERERDSLGRLPESFYRDAAEYVAELKRARERAAERADDPYGDPEVRELTDELDAATSVVESLYERRVGKVVKHASFAAADMPHDDEGLTDEERALFDDLVGRIRENRSRVLGALDGAAPDDEAPDDAAPAPTAERGGLDAAPASDDPAGMLAEAMGGGPRDGSDGPEPPTLGEERDPEPAPVESDEGANRDGPDTRADAAETPTPPGHDGATDRPDAGESATERTTVRITADVGEIYGVDDRSYRLEAEDVVSLPADNATPLVEKGAAERL